MELNRPRLDDLLDPASTSTARGLRPRPFHHPAALYRARAFLAAAAEDGDDADDDPAEELPADPQRLQQEFENALLEVS